jgi:hypothetical protein
MSPVFEISCKPPGSEPRVTFQWYGALPPVASSSVVYATPLVAARMLELQILRLAPVLLLKATVVVA